MVGVYAGFKIYGGETINSNFDRLLTNNKKISDSCSKLLIGGDFNADPNRPCPKTKMLDLWQTECGLDQIINKITRARLVDGRLQESMIDLVFIKDLDCPEYEVLPSSVSDHHIIAVEHLSKLERPIKFKKMVIVDWRNFKTELMSENLKITLKDLALSQSVDLFDRDLSMAILASMNNIIPKRVVHVRRDTDIVNYHMEAVKKKHNRLMKKANKTKDPKIMLRVKELNKVIKTVVKKERHRLIKNKMKNSSATTFWSTINRLIGRSGGLDGISLTDGAGIAMATEDSVQAFADFFQSKVEKLIDINPIEDQQPDITFQGISPFSKSEITKALETFKPKKSSGPDEIPLLLIRCCFQPIEPYVRHLFELICKTGKIPKMWKLARIKPIHKKGDPSKVENYRPISNLNSISKRFERCLLNRIQHLETDGPNQHGFRPCHSTTTAAIELQNYLANSLDSKKWCLVYSMDLSAAFDLVRPGIFVKKAMRVIEDVGLVKLMHEFITNRKAYVELEDQSSFVFELKAGTPQGSTLGPKIFNIYCNDLHDHIDGHLISYADDSYVVVCANSLEELKEVAVNTMTQHLVWLKTNGMVCNVEKTEMMIMNYDSPASIVVMDRMIKSQSSMKVLGIQFDTKMCWSEQVSNVIKKTNRMLHGLRKIRCYLDARQAKWVTTSFYFSVLYYGAEVWFHRHLSFHLKQKIRSAHYRALRLIHGDRDRLELDMIGQRATPDEWANYAVGKMMARMVLLQSPARLLTEIIQNSYSERRQENRLLFFDSSASKIGRQCIKNRLGCLAKQMKFDWLNADPNTLRPQLKKCFFAYAH